MDKLAPEEILNDARFKQPLYRMGEKQYIAMTAVYLASNAGNFVNGATLIIDGGLWLSHSRKASREAIQAISRVVERRSRETINAPKSRLYRQQLRSLLRKR